MNDESAPKPVKPLLLKRVVSMKLKKEGGEREQSSIAFAYMDLEAAITVARAMLDAGGVPLSRDQLAGQMKLVANSGNFVTKIATARLFGLLANNAGKYELTNLGFEIVDSDERRVRAAKAEAFLNVPLYRKVYDEFRGKQLPPRPHGLEQAFVRFGVSSKQKGNARLAFDKSASQAGFFVNGIDRLIEPIIGGLPPAREPSQEVSIGAPEPAARRSPPSDDLPHFMRMLIEKLPEPGTNWTVEGRAKWLQAAATSFDLMYMGDGSITIQAKPLHDEDKEND